MTEARVLPVAEVDERFARDEGEGFGSVAAWRRAHEQFFGRGLRDDEPIEAVRFRLTDLVVAGRYRGPARSGNGGYTCGLVAALLGGSDVQVTLRVPPPLDVPLRIGDGTLHAGETLVAEYEPASVELALPEPPGPVPEGVPDDDHPFPGCFTCGPAREPGDGLRLVPAPLGGGRVAARYRVLESSLQHVWAALDCPGAFAVNPGFERGVSLLGRLAAHVEEIPAAGEELAVVAWDLGGGDGRRSYAGTALFRGEQPLAWARATWFSLEDPLPSGA